MNTVNLAAIDDRNIRELVAEYADSVDADGMIHDRPGKFEAEPIWTVYFYAWSMDSAGETVYLPCSEQHADDEDCYCEDQRSYDVFKIDATDVEAFPWLDQYHGKEIVLWTDSQGFTMSHIVTDGTHDDWAQRYYGLEAQS